MSPWVGPDICPCEMEYCGAESIQLSCDKAGPIPEWKHFFFSFDYAGARSSLWALTGALNVPRRKSSGQRNDPMAVRSRLVRLARSAADSWLSARENASVRGQSFTTCTAWASSVQEDFKTRLACYRTLHGFQHGSMPLPTLCVDYEAFSTTMTCSVSYRR